MTEKRIPPRKSFILNWLIYVVPLVVFLVNVLFLGSFSLEEALQFVKNPFLPVFGVLIISLPLILYKYFITIITNYDGSEESIKKVNKNAQLYIKLSVYLPIVLNLALTPLLIMGYKGETTLYSRLTVIFQSLGSVFLYSLFFYILFMQSFEGFLGFVPLRKEFLSMNIKTRSILVAFFSVTGALLLCIAPLLGVESQEMLGHILLVRVLPLGLLAVILGIADFFNMMRGVSVRVAIINNFAQTIAKGDYSIKELAVISRDEFGMLVNNLNAFSNTTVNLVAVLKKILQQRK